MKLNQAMSIAAMNTAPTAVLADPFLGLDEDLLAELRDILTPAVTHRLMIEVDPVTKSAVGVGVGNAIYRVAVITSPSTGEQRAAILDGAMREIDKATFHDRIRQVCPAPPVGEPSPFVFDNDPPPKSLAQRQLECLEEIRGLLTEIRNRLP